MLEGKFQDDFEEWYEDKADRTDHLPPLNMFYELSASLQWGIFLDFINSMDHHIAISGAMPQTGLMKGVRMFVARHNGALISHEDLEQGIFAKTVKESRRYSLRSVMNLYNKYDGFS
jgi:hypothetical protein